MVQDYAKKNSGQPKKSKRNLILSIIIILFAVGFPLTMFFSRFHQINKTARPPQSTQKVNHSETTGTKKPKNDEDQKELPPKNSENSTAKRTQFDFYTLLPGIQAPSNTNTPPSTKNTLQAQYALQVISLQSHDDANRFKTQLNTLGFDAFIMKYQHQSKQWYRVLVGPYPTPALAQQGQSKLTKDNIDSILLKLRS